ncbi:hypothetical protein BDU57DRAFT_532413 [Ampelomyces quisqualis]|uniref:Uncharacterized protein n=1 Tax=Ampelomyces quisqualis TaxID=50730 RepID=A0A6A5QEX3_AMPQU|nr:hypothetical protein BDU57DRAFT_532413 [Ampelomyces quisqualis]
MPWTTTKTAGVTLGILLPVLLLITLASILVYRKRFRSPKPPPKSESEADAELALPGPIHQPGTVRRQTGQPQTFYDWVQRSNEEAGPKHTRYASVEHGPGPVIRGDIPVAHERYVYPSLENGPGPEIGSGASSVYSRPAMSRAGTARKDSIGGSSLRKAVLGAGEGEKRKEEAIQRKEVVVKEVKIEAKKVEERTALRGYSGAWP